MSVVKSSSEAPKLTGSTAFARHFDTDFDSSFQDVSCRNVDPTKLIALLRAKFGVGSYQIHVCIASPRMVGGHS